MADVDTVPVAVTRAEQPLAILYVVADDHRGIEREVTDEVIVEELAKAGLSDGEWVRIEADSIPADRSQRALWRVEDGRIVA